MNYSNFEIKKYYFFAKNTSVARLTGRTLNPPLVKIKYNERYVGLTARDPISYNYTRRD